MQALCAEVLTARPAEGEHPLTAVNLPNTCYITTKFVKKPYV
jgi:hypothetical protein